MKKFGLAVLTLSLVGLVGCQWPFSTQAQVKNYINKVEPIFNDDRQQVKDIGSRLNLEDFKRETIEQNLTTVKEIQDRVTQDQNQTQSISAPSQAQGLSDRFDQYYQIESEIMADFVDFFQYLLTTETYWNKPAQYAQRISDLPTNSLTKMAKELDKIGRDVQKDRAALKKIKANQLSKPFHKQLLRLYKALDSFLSDLVRAIETKNLSQIVQAGETFDAEMNSVKTAFSNIKAGSKMDKYKEKYDQSEAAVIEELNQLKERYNIKEK